MSHVDQSDEGTKDSLSAVTHFPFFVIRHSERIDEVCPGEWEALVQTTFRSGDPSNGLPVLAHSGKKPMPGTIPVSCSSSQAGKGSFSVASASSSSKNSPRGTSTAASKRSKAAFMQDPPLSSTNGPVYAEQAAETMASSLLPPIRSSLSSSYSSVSVRIYSSRFLRAVQTAVPLAIKLHLPIHVSFGLSTVLPQVAKTQDPNQFLSLGDLHLQFPSVSFISCDDPSQIETYLPTSGWIDSVHSIVQSSTESNYIAIIVGHRETVRGLTGKYLTTPYCTIAMFDRNRLDTVDVNGNGDEEEELVGEDMKESKAPLSFKNLKAATTSSSLGLKAVRPTAKAVSKVSSSEPKKKSSKQRDGPVYELLKLFDCRGNVLSTSSESK
jgi:broad specificity phosphatase PhoE